MTIERLYIAANANDSSPPGWEEISEAEFIRRTEWAGYWKPGTALNALQDAGMIRTPFAFYRLSMAKACRLAQA